MKIVPSLSTVLLCIAAMGVISCSDKKPTPKEKGQPILVRTQPIALQYTNPEITVSGQFSTGDEVDLSFKTGGIVKNVRVNEGDFVRKGQVLAELDLTEVGAGTMQSRLATEKARRDYERVLALYKDSVATLEQLQNAQTLLNVAREQDEATNFNYKYSKIYAPHNGYVLRKALNAGQLVGAGMPVLSVNGAGRGEWLLKAGISDRDWAKVAVGDRAEITAETLSGKKLQGTVIRKSQGIDAYSSTFFIEIRIEGSVAGLASGMFGSAVITAARKTGAYVIPHEALMDANAKTGFVFATNDGKTAIKVPVTIDYVSDMGVVLSSGLSGYKYLIVTGNAYLADKSVIKTVK